MRIISQDGSRDFPYENIALMLRIKIINDEELYSVYAIFNGKEYEMACYKNGEVAMEILNEIRNTPRYIIEENDEDEDDEDDEIFLTGNETEILFIKLPTQEEVDEIYE